MDDSMAPEFEKGCVIIIDPTGLATDGAFVLAEIGDEFLFRRLAIRNARASLHALNPAYDPVELEHGLQAVKGVIVQRAGRRRRYHKRYA